MAAEILDFYHKKLDQDAILKVYDLTHDTLLFETNLGRRLFRADQDLKLTTNREINVNYLYTGTETIEVKGYVFLGTEAVASFPEGDVHGGDKLCFRMTKDKGVVPGRSYTVRTEISKPLWVDFTIGLSLALTLVALIIVIDAWLN